MIDRHLGEWCYTSPKTMLYRTYLGTAWNREHDVFDVPFHVNT
jgi:hypothetical protein